MIKRTFVPAVVAFLLGSPFSSGRAQAPAATPVTIITSEDIQRRNITRLDELFQGLIPGFIALDQDGSGQAKWQGRGVAGIGVQTRIRVFLNGTELDNPSHISRINPEFVDRIEVISGLAASVEAGATGGVVRIFTKRGAPQPAGVQRSAFVPSVTTLFSAGSEQSLYNRGASLNQRHALNLTGGTQLLGYYFGGGYTSNGNYAPQAKSNGSNAILGIATTSRFISANVFGTIGQITSNVPQERIREAPGTGIQAAPIVPMPRQTQQTRFKNNSFGGTVALTLMPWWHQEIRAGNSYGGHGSEGLRIGVDFDTVPMSANGHQVNRRLSYTYTTSFTLPQFSIIRPTIRAGYEHIRLKRNTDTTNAMVLNGVDTLFANWSSSSMEQKLSSYFATLGLTVGDALAFNAGIRHGHDHIITDSDMKGQWSPYASAAYRLTPGRFSITTRAAYGSINTKSIDPSAFFGGFPGSTPSTDLPKQQNRMIGAEGGIDLELENGPRFSVTIFDQHGRDGVSNPFNPVVVIQLPLGDLRPFFNQALMTLETRGAEFTAQWARGPFETRAAYSIAKTNVKEIDPAYPEMGRQYEEDQVLANTPRQNGALWLAYTRGNTSIGTEARYIGSHTERNFIVQATTGSPTAVYGASTLYNVTLTHALTSRVSLLGYVYNLTNTERYTSTNLEYSRGRRLGLGVRTR